MSKRSKIALTALAGFSALTLAACKEETTPAQVFSSLESCQAEAQKPESWWTLEECDEAFASAQKLHAETAPRYDALAVCEEQHGIGNCAADQYASGSGGGSIFLPLIGGYLLGSALSGGSKPHLSSSRPLYSTSTGKFATADGGLRFNSNSGGTKIAPKSFTMPRSTIDAKPMTKASVTRAGGFGAARTSTAARSGSFGG